MAAVVCILIGIRVQQSERPDRLVPPGPGSRRLRRRRLLRERPTASRSRRSGPHPTAANAFYLAGYLFTIAAAIRLSRNPNQSGRREGYADAAIISLGALAISWHFLINAYVYDASLTSFGTLVVLGYPAMDLALIFIVFHSLLFRAVRPSLPQAHRRRPDRHRVDRLRPRRPRPPCRRLQRQPGGGRPAGRLRAHGGGGSASFRRGGRSPNRPSRRRASTGARPTAEAGSRSWPSPVSSRRASSWCPAASAFRSTSRSCPRSASPSSPSSTCG